MVSPSGLYFRPTQTPVTVLKSIYSSDHVRSTKNQQYLLRAQPIDNNFVEPVASLTLALQLIGFCRDTLPKARNQPNVVWEYSRTRLGKNVIVVAPWAVLVHKIAPRKSEF